MKKILFTFIIFSIFSCASNNKNLEKTNIIPQFYESYTLFVGEKINGVLPGLKDFGSKNIRFNITTRTVKGKIRIIDHYTGYFEYTSKRHGYDVVTYYVSDGVRRIKKRVQFNIIGMSF